MMKALQFAFVLLLTLSFSTSFAQTKGKATEKKSDKPTLSPASSVPTASPESMQEKSVADKELEEKKASNGIFLVFLPEGKGEVLKEIIRRFPGTVTLAYPAAPGAVVVVNKTPEFSLFQEAYANQLLILSEADLDKIQTVFPGSAEFKTQLLAFVAKSMPAK